MQLCNTLHNIAFVLAKDPVVTRSFIVTNAFSLLAGIAAGLALCEHMF